MQGRSVHDDEILLRRGDFLAEGRDDHELQRGVRLGTHVRVAPGAFVRTTDWEALDGRQQHVVRVRAVVSRLGPRVVVAGESALAFHRVPVLGRWPDRVHVVDPHRGSTLSSRTLVRHAAPLDESEVTHVHGVRVLAPVRATMDAVRRRDLRGAVVALDDALGRGLVSRDAARSELDGRRGLPGRRLAALALDLADGASGSPGESLSRVGVHLEGLPRPVLQHEFRDGGGFVARVDFWWPCCGVVGEFDGAVKYLDRATRSGRTAEEVVVDEKRREDRLRALEPVRGVARWTWRDALEVAPMIGVLRRAGLAACRHRSPWC